MLVLKKNEIRRKGRNSKREGLGYKEKSRGNI